MVVKTVFLFASELGRISSQMRNKAESISKVVLFLEPRQMAISSSMRVTDGLLLVSASCILRRCCRKSCCFSRLLVHVRLDLISLRKWSFLSLAPRIGINNYHPIINNSSNIATSLIKSGPPIRNKQTKRNMSQIITSSSNYQNMLPLCLWVSGMSRVQSYSHIRLFCCFLPDPIGGFRYFSVL